MTKRIFIAGHYGFGNTGDEAILCSMVAHLREIRPGLQITVATGTPEKTAEALGTDAALWSDARAVFESVREADLVIVGGGGIFHDYAGINPDTFLTDNHWGISYFTGPAMMAALYGRPVMLYAVGVGPLFSEHARQLTKVACEAAAAITVRDAGSQQLLESIGVARDRVVLTADPAFGFLARRDGTPAAAFSSMPRPRVAVALRPWEVGVHSGFWERETAAGLDRFLRHHGGSVLFVPFERRENAVEDDLAVARRVHSYMKLPNAASVCEADLSPEQTLTVLGECDLVVGMRLHSLILGMLARLPVVALNYDDKVDQAMRRVGLQDFSLDVRSLDAAALATLIKDALQAKRQVAIEELASAARQNAAIAVAVLDRGEGRAVLKPAAAAMLGRGIQAQLRDIHSLRGETRRLFHELEFYQSKNSSSAAEANRLAERIANLETERSQILSDLASLSTASQNERTALLARADELAREKEGLQAETARLESDVHHLRGETHRLSQEAGRASELETERSRILSELAARSTASQNEQTALLARVDELAREKEGLQAETARLEREIQRVLALETERSQILSELTALSTASLNERTALLARADELAREKEGLQAETARAAGRISVLETELAALSAATQNERVALLGRVDELAREKEALQEETARLEGEIHNLRGEIHRLSQEADRVPVLEAESATLFAASLSERTTLQARADELAGQLAQMAREKEGLQEETARLDRLLGAEGSQRAKESEKHHANQARLEGQIAALTADQEKQRALQASMEGELRTRISLQREISDGLRKAEELRRQVIGRLNQFQNKLAADVELYRAQRAWKVMLAIRKGYAIRARRGFAAFLRWAFALPFAGPGPLQEYELGFPDLGNYLPERLHAPHDLMAAQPEQAYKLADLIPPRKYDVIILAIFDFDFRFQRPQQVAAQFARKGHRVFWVSPARFLDSAAEKPYEAVPLRENLWEVRLPGRRPDLYGGQLLPEETASYAASLKCLYRDFQISESCSLLQFPYWRQLGLALREGSGSLLVYDCMDDWQNWTAEPRIGAFSLSEERKLVRDCDVLVVSSQEFQARHVLAGISPLLMRNGADFDFFAAPRQNDLLAGLPRPIVGYYGAIADWFDLDLLAAAASARPQVSFVLIGQVHEVDTSRLSALPNVHLLGEKHYREIPLFLAHFDVCLIPFKLTALTKGVDPVKLYEYLSQGKPVVATDLAELPHDSELLYIAEDAADFIEKIDLALEERSDRAKQASRVDYARANTWASRVDELDRSISAKFPLVSILVVTYNCEEFMELCLDAVAGNTSWPRYELILVDNNSTDGTQEILGRYAKADDRVRLLLQSENLGFAAANNLAAKAAQGEYIVFLNPDTVVSEGWVGRLIRHCELDSTVGAVAAVTNFSGNETKIKVEYTNVMEMRQFAMDLAAEKQNQSTAIDVAPLYCVAVPRVVWRKVGELDPGFQVGMFEDDDFSLRIRRAGYRVVAAEDCFVHHFGNGSFSKLAHEESLRIFEQNRQRFEQKWSIPWQPHKLRCGVLPPSEEARFTPVEFMHAHAGIALKTPEPLIVNRLHPSQTVAGKSFNTQAGGASALVVECANATPNTVIVMDSTILQTSYGKPDLLSGLVPPELYARVGRRRVHLLNDFGESGSMDFEVLVPDPRA